MPTRAQYVLTRQPVPLAELLEKLAAAGLPSSARPERGHWFRIQFDTHKSDALAYTHDGKFDLLLFNFDRTDPPSLAATIEQVMRSVGFTQEQPAFWRLFVPLVPWAAIMLLAYAVWRALW